MKFTKEVAHCGERVASKAATDGRTTKLLLTRSNFILMRTLVQVVVGFIRVSSQRQTQQQQNYSQLFLMWTLTCPGGGGFYQC